MKRLLLVLILLFLVSCGLEIETLTPTVTPVPTLTSTSIPMFRVPMFEGELPVKKYTYYFPIMYNTQTSEKSIGNEFLKYGIEFGFSVGSSIRTNEIQREIVLQHAKIVTMENEYKMKRTQPIEDIFTFWGADQIILFGKENNMDVYGHGISWAIYNPIWVSELPKSEMAYELDRHVRIVCSHFQGLSAVDVANEAYANGTLNAGDWSPLGEDYVNISFNSCRDVTNLKIFYNSLFPNDGDVANAFRLVDSGLADGIGIQFHLSEGTDYQGLFNRTRYIIKESRKRGTPVRFSEVGVWATSEETQANIYRDVVRLALDNSDVVTEFIVWGVTDPAWRGDVVLFHSDGSPKQSVDAILDELEDN